jgi:hypothetical protein
MAAAADSGGAVRLNLGGPRGQARVIAGASKGPDGRAQPSPFGTLQASCASVASLVALCFVDKVAAQPFRRGGPTG